MGNGSSESASAFNWIPVVFLIGAVAIALLTWGYVQAKKDYAVLKTQLEAESAKPITFELAHENNDPNATLWFYAQVQGGKNVRFFNNNQNFDLKITADAGCFQNFPSGGVTISKNGGYYDTTVLEGLQDFKVLSIETELIGDPEKDHGGSDMIVGDGP